MGNSVVENINTLANSTESINGNIISDASDARDEAQLAAAAANASAVEALASENKASDWADRGHNNPVTGTPGVDAKYSSYHWAVEAGIQGGGNLIDDTITSNSATWSSSNISDRLDNKSSILHTHAGIYEPAFTKGTAFNKDFGTTVSDVATGYHLHNGANGSANYEPAIGAKGTGFNKDIGTTSGTLAEGNHTHSYEPSFSKNSAFNKNFVIDVDNPLETEIPRGNHLHSASSVTLDSTSAEVITSGTVQGGVMQLDSVLGNFTVAEKCKLTAGMTGTSQVVTIAAAGTAVKLITAMTVNANSKNALYSGGNIVIDYDTAPTQYVEGWYAATVALDVDSGKEYAIGVAVNDTLIDTEFTSHVGNSTKSLTGTFSLSIEGFLSNLENTDEISLYVFNMTDTTNVTIRSHTASFAGQPEGALVSSNNNITHNDTISRDATDAHPISAITDLQTTLNGKAASSHTHTVSEVTDFDPADKQDLVVPASSGNIATLDGTGNLTDGSKTVAQLALVEGNASQIFNVADGVAGTDAVNFSQLDTLSTTVDGKISSVSTPTAGNFPQLDASGNLVNSIYDELSFAAAAHTHSIANVTDLQTALDSRYIKVTTPVTDNVVTFGSGDVIKDSGIESANIAQINVNNVFSVAQRGNIKALLPSSGVTTISLADGNTFRVSSLSEDTILNNPINMPAENQTQGGIIIVPHNNFVFTFDTYWKLLGLPASDNSKTNIYGYQVISTTEIIYNHLGEF